MAPQTPEQLRRVAAAGTGNWGKEVAAWMVCGYLLLIMLGFILLLRGGTMRSGNDLTRDRAFFLAMNAATLTGFQTHLSFSTETLQGPLVMLMLTIGGMITSLGVGGLAVVRILRLPYSDKRVLTWAVGATLVAVLMGTIFFSEGGSHFSALKVVGSFQRTASAFGNSGVVTGKMPPAPGWKSLGVMMPLAVLGGLGLPVLMELFDAARGRRKLSTHSNTVLVMSAALFLLGFAVVLMMRWPEGLSFASRKETRESLAAVVETAGAAATTSVNVRTAGFPYEFANAMPRILQWVVILLMMIGASPAGTGGGLKTTTLAAIYRGVRSGLRGQSPGRGFAIAVVWVGAYMAVVLLIFLALLTRQTEQAADRILFETISAVSNVGTSYDTVVTTRENLFILSGGMLLGRLLPLGILWWLARTPEETELAVG